MALTKFQRGTPELPVKLEQEQIQKIPVRSGNFLRKDGLDYFWGESDTDLFLFLN